VSRLPCREVDTIVGKEAVGWTRRLPGTPENGLDSGLWIFAIIQSSRLCGLSSKDTLLQQIYRYWMELEFHTKNLQNIFFQF
jgi:hypothetical protein